MSRSWSKLAWPFVFAWVALLAPSSALAQSPQDVAQRGFASSATVLTYDASGQALGIGSGFAIAPDQVLTNAHVIAGASHVSVRPIQGEDDVPVTELLLVDEQMDLALMRVGADTLDPIPLRGDTASSVGDSVYAVGSPLGLEGTFSEGIVSGYRTVGDVELMQITAPVSPGSSGGPVLNGEGDVVGVAMGALVRGQNLNFAIPSTLVSSFLKQEHSPQPIGAAETVGGEAPAVDVGGALNEAVQGTTLRFDAFGSYTFSVRNQLPRAVHDIEVLVVFYDAEDRPLDVDNVRVRKEVPAGLAQRIASEVDASVQEVVTGSPYNQEVATRVEIRVLDFDFVGE